MDSEKKDFIKKLLEALCESGCGAPEAPESRCNLCEARLKNILSLADRVGHDNIAYLFDSIAKIGNKNAGSARYFVNKSSQLVDEVGYNCFEKIVKRSLELFDINGQRALSFAKGESEEYVDFIREFSDSVRLKEVKPVLTYYVNALLGYSVGINETDKAAFTDGEKIYLPKSVNEFNDKDMNFVLYKVLATHEEAHLQYGSFDFDIGKVSDIVDKLRSKFGGENGGKQ